MEKKLLISLTAAALFLMPVVNLSQTPDLNSVSSFALSYFWENPGTGATINGTLNDFAANATSIDLTLEGLKASVDPESPEFPFAEIIPPANHEILGLPSIIPGQKHVSYMVLEMFNAITYNWTYSGKGATITGNSNAILIDFDITATSGRLIAEGISLDGIVVGSAGLKINLKNTDGGISNDKQANLTSENGVANANTMYVYPNPANNEINIVSDHNLKSILLFNFIGETVYNETVSGNKVQVDVSGYLPGLYFIQINTQSGLAVKRVTIR